MKVTVDGAELFVEPRTLRVEHRINEPSKAKFEVVDYGDNYIDVYTDSYRNTRTFQKGQTATVVDDADQVLFAGVVDSADRNPSGPNMIHKLSCRDWHYLTNRRVVSKAYENTTVGAIATDLVTFVADDGVTVGQIDAGPTVQLALFNYVSVSHALDAMAERAGFAWWLDANKALWFVARNTVTAPHSIVDSEVRRFHGGDKAPDYRNRQYVRGGRDETDPQTERYAGDGERRTFNVAYPVARVPTVTLNGLAQTVGIRGVEEGKDWYWSKNSTEISQDEAAIPIGSADVLEVVYRGFVEIVVVSTDQDAIQNRQAVEGFGTGLVDHVHEEPELQGRSAAFELAGAKLDRYAKVGQTVQWETWRSGLAPGQLATVDVADFPGEMLITEVVMRLSGVQPLYDVKAVTGPAEGSWVKFFAKVAEAPRLLVFRENISEDEVLIVLEQFAEAWGWVGALAVTATACPFPSSTTYPSSTLYPC